MKKFFAIFLVLVVILIILNIGPVWLQRLIGFNGYSEKAYFPQWINNEEYCYLKVESFFDYGLGFSGISKDFYNPLKFFRGSNATFYIYKVNINQPDEEKLIRKITKKVDFSTPPEGQKLHKRGKLIFRRLDNGKLVLLIRGCVKYIAYFMNTDGRIANKQVFDYERLDKESIVDISPDATSILIRKIDSLYVRNINTKQEHLLSEAQLYHYDHAKWINSDNFAIYRIFDFYSSKRNEQDRYEVYVADDDRKNLQLLHHAPYNVFEKVRNLLLDVTFSSKDESLFLSKIGIFKKEGRKWQQIKDLKDMNYNFFYPDWSPDGKRLVGVLDDGNLRVVEVEDLLGD